MATSPLTVGERILGLQVNASRAVANWQRPQSGRPVRIVAIGPGSSLAATVATALDSGSGHVEAVETTDALKSVLDGKRRFRVDPQLFTADLLTRFAVDEIVDLADGKVLRKLTP